jgi:hypothetical protein
MPLDNADSIQAPKPPLDHHAAVGDKIAAVALGRLVVRRLLNLGTY